MRDIDFRVKISKNEVRGICKKKEVNEKYKILVETSEGMKQLKGSNRRWHDSVKIDLKENEIKRPVGINCLGMWSNGLRLLIL
jgi:hypothetical protein